MSATAPSGASHPIRIIQIQLLKSTLVLSLLVFLAIYQREFLTRAVLSHPELNLLIIGVFCFGAAMAMKSLVSLFQEDRALSAMKEAWADFDEMEQTDDGAGVKRLLRASEPGIVFRAPRIFGQVYDLVMDELLKTRGLRLSLAQRHSMLGMVHEAINREKSLVNYITGVMILLGLIGTFIGLMEMVASVGGIIGGLARAGSGSDEAIKNVIKDLEAPLTGMATGFSASLFGLLGSLVLGLVARFGQSATHGLKHDFEGWLSKISQLEPQGAALAAQAGSAGPDGSVAALASSLLGAFRTTQGLISRSADVMRKLSERQDMQTAAVTKLCDQVEALSTRQAFALGQLKRTDMIGDAVEGMRQEAILRERATANRIAEGVGRIVQGIENSRAELGDAVAGVGEQHRATERMARALELQTTRGFEDIALQLSTMSAEGNERGRIALEGQSEIEKLVRTSLRPLDTRMVADQVGAAVDERLAAGFGAVAGAFDQSLAQLVAGIDRLGATQAELSERLIKLNTGPLAAEEMRGLTRSIEQGLASGLADIAKVLDGLMAARVERVVTEAAGSDPATPIIPPAAPQTGAANGQYDAVFERFGVKSGRRPANH